MCVHAQKMSEKPKSFLFIPWFGFPILIRTFPLLYYFEVLQRDHFSIPVAHEGNGCSVVFSV